MHMLYVTVHAQLCASRHMFTPTPVAAFWETPEHLIMHERKNTVIYLEIFTAVWVTLAKSHSDQLF